MVSGISLSNKCQFLFGFAVVMILAGALSVPWILTRMLTRESEVEVARQLADAWLADRIQLGAIGWYRGIPIRSSDLFDDPDEPPALRMTLVQVEQIDPDDESRPFLAAALQRFRTSADETEHQTTTKIGGKTVHQYARALTESQMQAIRDRTGTVFRTTAFEPGLADPLRAILLVERASQFAESQLLISRVYITSAGLVASLLAVLVFYLILTKLILSPVRKLRATTEKVEQGDLAIRSQIKTGDEFEQLSQAFNSMLDRLEQGLEVALAEPPASLFLLDEMVKVEADPDPKRHRYLQNILISGRSLLEMINELLDMTKIEANRFEVTIEPTSVADLIEGLVGIMRPQASAKGITFRTQVSQHVPLIETDPGKLQQILYNFLSNALKFTPAGGTVTISADRVTRQDNTLGVRLAVADTGPGIPYDQQDVIFEKFRQLDASHTREHPGTGLGLAICRELAQMLNATVSFVSEPGCGATFFVDLPQAHQPDEPQPLMG